MMGCASGMRCIRSSNATFTSGLKPDENSKYLQTRTVLRGASYEQSWFVNLIALVQVPLLRYLEVLRINGHHLNR
jgi:hypothetical protein